MTRQDLLTSLSTLIDAARERTLLVVSRSVLSEPAEKWLPAGCTMEWLRDVRNADDVHSATRADLCIVFQQLEHMEKLDGTHLLSRLRDHHCKRMLLHCADRKHGSRELFALGFIKQECPSVAGRLFVFDPDVFFERREWNTPDKWANPENFAKYRW